MISELGHYWYKCDFHCHTPDDPNWVNPSNNTIKKKEFVKKFIKKAINEDFRLIAITDHYNYQDYLESYMYQLYQEASKKDLTIIPGCELTARDGKEGIHILIFFSDHLGDTPKSTFKIIKRLMVQFHPVKNSTKSKVIPLAKMNIEQIYQTLKQEIPKQFLMAFAHVDSVKGILNKKDLDKTLRKEKWNNSEVKIAQWKKDPYSNISGFLKEIANNSSRDFKRKIHIVGSDCKSLDPSGDPNTIHFGQKFMWIKSIPNFKGLVHTFQDPEGLIDYGDKNPALRLKQSFSEICLKNHQMFEDTNFQFTEQKFSLNRDLITIIGSRGSGKSLLLNVFAKLHQISDEYYEPLSRFSLSKDFQVTFSKEDGEELVSTTLNPNAIDYIHVHQGEFKIICEDVIKMNLQIEDLLQILPYKHNSRFNDEIRTLIKDYISNIDWMDEQDEDGNYINLEEYHNNLIDKYEKKIKIIQIESTKENIKSLRENEREINNSKQYITKLQKIKEKIEQEFKLITQKIEKINPNLKKSIPVLDATPQFQIIDENMDILSKKISRMEEKNHKIKNEFIKLGIEDSDYKIDQIKIYETYISNSNKAIDEIREKRKRVSEIFPKLLNIYNSLEKEMEGKINEIKKKWESLKTLSFPNPEQKEIHEELLKGIEIEPIIYFDKEEFYNLISVPLNKNKFRERGNLTAEKRIQSTFNIESYNEFENIISDISVIQIEKTSMKLSDFILKREFFNKGGDEAFLNTLYLANNLQKYIRVLCKIRFLGREPGSLSMGERGTLYLRLKLATAKFTSPFIFDQPEDDLDNVFIQTKLVPLLSKIKKYRQIIIATHNANIVVNGNADQIFVCKNDDEKISYTSGCLSDELIQKEVCSVLEGGDDALLHRARKYNLIDYF